MPSTSATFSASANRTLRAPIRASQGSRRSSASTLAAVRTPPYSRQREKGCENNDATVPQQDKNANGVRHHADNVSQEHEQERRPAAEADGAPIRASQRSRRNRNSFITSPNNISP